MRSKKYYKVEVVTASSAEEAREKIERGLLDEYDYLNGRVVPGKRLHKVISSRTVIPPKSRSRNK